LFLHPVLVLPADATDSPWVALTPCLLKSTQARCLQPACENWVT
jgi:hypothetical protein